MNEPGSSRAARRRKSTSSTSKPVLLSGGNPQIAKSALQTRFDLHRDSLPVLDTDSIPLSHLLAEIRLALAATRLPSEAGRLASELLREPE